MLQLTAISKRFAGTDFILNPVSVCLGKGLNVLVGPNGAGKSTLLRMIAAIMKPDEGSFLCDGCDVFADVRRYKMGLGYLPQNFGCYEHMTGMEFLRYMAGLKGLFHEQGRERPEYVAELLEIGAQCSIKVAAWSNGLRQRLGIAQALLNNPKILVLDEPFCGLDAAEMEKAGELLSQLSQERVVLISTHILTGLAMDQLLLIIQGTLQFAGLPTVFIDEAQGKVWAGETSKSEGMVLQQRYPGSEAVFDGEHCRYRILSSTRPLISGAKSVEPSLEDAYLFWVQRFREADRG
ncbi:ABC-type multidrug transport system ATPase subunit [Sporomusaceae bacterium BoRhaA]|uniref:ATP-binding cassette domain-containing protein n=1 Tax=Pelorhabdus rhamnosifermentans TaxID=2772457 RepID=UPI001C061748|nr:ATP-binding cassette domain-containing protein [Pelorhabdus rhamnosifermentans]MBU2699554.1 ABC-type multidrug transport system ATPase subunit [Pelorhabdus rhamnosifermentans]